MIIKLPNYRIGCRIASSSLGGLISTNTAMFLVTIVGSGHSFDAILFISSLAIDAIKTSVNEASNRTSITNLELGYFASNLNDASKKL